MRTCAMVWEDILLTILWWTKMVCYDECSHVGCGKWNWKEKTKDTKTNKSRHRTMPMGSEIKKRWVTTASKWKEEIQVGQRKIRYAM